MRTYIKRGRFGEFVDNIISLEYERKKEEAEKEDNRMMWELYVHSATNESFLDWKKRVLSDSTGQKKKTRDEDLTDSDIINIVNRTFSK